MPIIRATALVCTVRKHGEHGAVVRVLTRDDGLQAGYVRGGRSRTLRPILMPGNVVQAELRSRLDDQLASLTVELVKSRAPFFAEPLAASAFSWTTLLSGTVLPEAQAFPRLYDSLFALLDLVCVAPSARWWARALVEYERQLLAELGFGMDLSQCTLTGAVDDLAYVSPRTGRAVSRVAGEGHRDRLLELPSFLLGQDEPDWQDILAGLKLTGHFLERNLFPDVRRDRLAARDQMIDRLKRMVA